MRGDDRFNETKLQICNQLSAGSTGLNITPEHFQMTLILQFSGLQVISNFKFQVNDMVIVFENIK